METREKEQITTRFILNDQFNRNPREVQVSSNWSDGERFNGTLGERISLFIENLALEPKLEAAFSAVAPAYLGFLRAPLNRRDIRRTRDHRVHRSSSDNRVIKVQWEGCESDRSFDERRCEFISLSDRITKASYDILLHIKNNNQNNLCLTLEGISRIDYTRWLYSLLTVLTITLRTWRAKVSLISISRLKICVYSVFNYRRGRRGGGKRGRHARIRFLSIYPNIP